MNQQLIAAILLQLLLIGVVITSSNPTELNNGQVIATRAEQLLANRWESK